MRAPYRDLPRYREPPGPEPTIGDLLADCHGKWAYLYCTHYLCGHHAAIAFATFAIRYGLDAPMSKVRAGFRCTACGRKGARITRPLADTEFPASEALRF